LTRQSIALTNNRFFRWMRGSSPGSSPRMTGRGQRPLVLWRARHGRCYRGARAAIHRGASKLLIAVYFTNEMAPRERWFLFQGPCWVKEGGTQR
jgi:hypothetical protein